MHLWAQEAIYSFNEVLEARSSEFKSLYTIQLLQKIYNNNPPALEQVVTSSLQKILNTMTVFKKTNPQWSVGDKLAARLSDPQGFKRMSDKVLLLFQSALMQELEHNPDNYVVVYYTMPRIIFDFRTLLQKKIPLLSPEIRDQILKRFYRYPFTKEGYKDGYLKQWDQRYQVTFATPKSGDFALLGKKYPPGMTFYSQSYSVLGNFSLVDDPYNLNTSVLFQFLAGASFFKEPYGLLNRDLKRLFPQSLEDRRQDIEKRLLRLQNSLEHLGRNYLIQHFIPQAQLDTYAHLEFFGLGFPVYLDKKGKVDFRKEGQPIYLKDEALLSPKQYRNSFVVQKGNPGQYHLHQDLPQKSLLKTPVFPLRLYFSEVLFPIYETYKFPVPQEKEYKETLEKIVDEIINSVSTAKFKDEKDQPVTGNEILLKQVVPPPPSPDKSPPRETRSEAADIKDSHPEAHIITTNQAIHSGGGQRVETADKGQKSQNIINVDKNAGEIGGAVTSVVQDLAKQLFAR